MSAPCANTNRPYLVPATSARSIALEQPSPRCLLHIGRCYIVRVFSTKAPIPRITTSRKVWNHPLRWLDSSVQTLAPHMRKHIHVCTCIICTHVCRRVEVVRKMSIITRLSRHRSRAFPGPVHAGRAGVRHACRVRAYYRIQPDPRLSIAQGPPK